MQLGGTQGVTQAAMGMNDIDAGIDSRQLLTNGLDMTVYSSRQAMIRVIAHRAQQLLTAKDLIRGF